jgi:hypothetical protein
MQNEIQAVNKDQLIHMMVLDHAAFATETNGRTNGLGQDILSMYDQDDFTSVGFCCNNSTRWTGVCVSFF